jgi:putative nucleotidyltransferase with HDIG domain
MTSVRHPDRLLLALKLVADLPPLSPLVRHLLATLYSPADDISLSQLALWIEKDTLTAGRILALANSAYYARAEPIVSIRHAVSRLGLTAIRNLVTSMAMSRYWNRIPTPAEWSTSRFNAHSIGVAVLSEMIAATIRADNAQVAFLAGLFHDVGHIGIAVLLRDDAYALKRSALRENVHQEQLELELLGFSHSELSAAMVRSWNLPRVIEQAVQFHEAEIDCRRITHEDLELSGIVHLADCHVDREGLSISGVPKQNKDEFPNLDRLGLPKVFTRFHEELDTLLSVI